MISRIETPRLVCGRPDPAAKARLFCFPYAGGGPQIYRNWPQKLSPSVEFFTVLMPGRGNRLSERLYTSVAHAVEDLSGSFEQYLNKPIVFFGYSLGALICFELAHRLRDKYGIEPGLLIIAARTAPHIPNDDPPTYNLPDEALIKELQRLNGTPREVLDHPELMELMLPMIRADFQMAETYTFVERAPLNCPIAAIGGVSDPEVPRESLEAWRGYTKGRFTLDMLPGDHFIIHSAESAVVELVNRRLNVVINHCDGGETCAS